MKQIILLTFILTLIGCSEKIDFSGKYNLETQYNQNSILIEKTSENEANFKMVCASGPPSYNTGELEGQLTVENNKAEFRTEFEFSNSFCGLKFEFFEDSLIVSYLEDGFDCGFGMNVYADGTYIKK